MSDGNCERVCRLFEGRYIFLALVGFWDVFLIYIFIEKMRLILKKVWVFLKVESNIRI